MRQTSSRCVVALALAATVVCATPAATRGATQHNPFGVMFSDSSEELAEVGARLGADHVRRLVSVATWDGKCGGCGPFLDRGMKIILTARYNGTNGTPSTPPLSLSLYQTQLAAILDSIDPEVLVVENEETASLYYQGSAKKYGAQLEAACRVAHERSIPCANGGLPNPTVIAMTYLDLLDRGKADAADSYLKGVVLDQDEYDFYSRPVNEPKVRRQADEGERYASRYAGAGADFINFHWYRESPKAFKKSVNYLERFTDLPAMSNEMGQYNNSREQIKGIMNKVLDLELRYAVWCSDDKYVEAQDENIRALHKPDFTLRKHGKAYKSIARDL